MILNVHGVEGKHQHHTGSHEGATVEGGTPDIDGRGGKGEDGEPDTDSEFGHDADACEEEGHETHVVVGIGLFDAVAGTVEERSLSVGGGNKSVGK